MKISDFVPNDRHLQEVLIFLFHSKKTVAEAHREFKKVYGDSVRDWFRRFAAIWMLMTVQHEGKPKTFEDAELEALLERNHYWGMVSNSTDAIEPSSARKTVMIYEQGNKKGILQHDNAPPHVAKYAKTYLETLKWEVQQHSPHSPDIAPSEFLLVLFDGSWFG